MDNLHPDRPKTPDLITKFNFERAQDANKTHLEGLSNAITQWSKARKAFEELDPRLDSLFANPQPFKEKSESIQEMGENIRAMLLESSKNKTKESEYQAISLIADALKKQSEKLEEINKKITETEEDLNELSKLYTETLEQVQKDLIQQGPSADNGREEFCKKLKEFDDLVDEDFSYQKVKKLRALGKEMLRLINPNQFDYISGGAEHDRAELKKIERYGKEFNEAAYCPPNDPSYHPDRATVCRVQHFCKLCKEIDCQEWKRKLERMEWARYRLIALPGNPQYERGSASFPNIADLEIECQEAYPLGKAQSLRDIKLNGLVDPDIFRIKDHIPD